MTFTLTIELGNDAMQSGHDLGDALLGVCRIVERNWDSNVVADGGKILDINGNTVGQWEVK